MMKYDIYDLISSKSGCFPLEFVFYEIKTCFSAVEPSSANGSIFLNI